jgi:hypothetical protein
MLVRTRFLGAFALVLAAACGGSSSNGAPAAASTACSTPGVVSTPGGADDVCANDKATVMRCAFQSEPAVATCGPSGTWGPCDCLPNPISSTAPPQAPGCGDGVVQANEDCERGVSSIACDTLVKGSSGIVMCTGCKWDVGLCHIDAPTTTGTGGTGAGGTGATAGTGGTGR